MRSCFTFFASKDPYLSHLFPGSLFVDGRLRLREYTDGCCCYLCAYSFLLPLVIARRADGDKITRSCVEEGKEARARFVSYFFFFLFWKRVLFVLLDALQSHCFCSVRGASLESVCGHTKAAA